MRKYHPISVEKPKVKIMSLLSEPMGEVAKESSIRSSLITPCFNPNLGDPTRTDYGALNEASPRKESRPPRKTSYTEVQEKTSHVRDRRLAPVNIGLHRIS